MIWLQHAFVALLVIGGPLWDHYEFKRLKTTSDPKAKARWYRKMILAQWIASAVVLLLVGKSIWRAPFDAVLLHNSITKAIVVPATLGVLVTLFLPFLFLGKPKVREAIRKSFSKLDFFLPNRRAEFPWFAMLCITAGICEEWIMRGFLLRYFLVTPWRLGIVTAVVLAAAIFGLNHLYQGIGGMASTALLAILFTFLYLMTGTLLVPMILHAVIDLRGWALLRLTQFPEEG